MIRTFLACILATASASAVDVALKSPLTTIVPVPGRIPAGPQRIAATIVVPPDAPADLGVGAYVRDRHGRWWQRTFADGLRPGVNHVLVDLAEDQPVAGPGAAWAPPSAATAANAGLFLWSASASRAVVRIDGLRTLADDPPDRDDPALTRIAPDAPTVATGARWSVRAVPQPYPADPYDTDAFSLTLIVTAPDGREERFAGFHEQPMRAHDRGDREEVEPLGAPQFTVRWRPRAPGVHRLRLEAAWARGGTVAAPLADVAVSGAAQDPYVRLDAKDPRYFAANGDFFWPLGPNLRSITDPRSGDRLGTKPTPVRGTLAYDAYLDRLAAHGVNAVEIWLSSWNLALEWRGDWPGYHGVGRYHEGHAWQLDRILDAAWARGIRVNLAVNNHGQGSGWVDSEWKDSPYNRANGGPLRSPEELLTSATARSSQDQVRRYLTARYADHPAIMAWKLWTEVDFVGEQQRRYEVEPLLVEWHENAARRWKALDPYDHLVTTHWSSNWTRVHPVVAATPGIEFLCFNAYHYRPGRNEGWILADLFQQSVARQALGRYRKALLCTEFGGQFDGCPEPQMIAEHASGAYCGIVCGLAGAPMLWWYEWIDQGARFAPYEAAGRFMAGEDLRDPRGQSIPLATGEPGVWVRAWSRPGRLLGYLLDLGWQTDGADRGTHAGTRITVAEQIAAGAMTVAWWDADAGRQLSEQRIDHPGGALVLAVPAWNRHLAFKLIRR